ncbi:MAG: DUF1297 domain-containing protein [Patescibacteria group bacterium]
MVDIQAILSKYDTNDITIASLGGHVALDIAAGAKAQGFQTLVIAREDRARPYAQYLKTEGKLGCVDEVVTVKQFGDILDEKMQETLRSKNTLIAHSRYFWVYFDFKDVEEKLRVPLIGSRSFLRLEERDQSPNQYDVLRSAGIRIPRIFAKPEDIDRLTLTKVHNATRTYERENFFARTPQEWHALAKEKVKSGAVAEADMQKAVIEEFILGAPINFNFFFSPLHNRLELMGTDIRRQTSLDGWLRLPASEQLKVGGAPFHIETGHIAVTVKESLLEKAYEAGEKFVAACKQHDPHGIVGPFALQGAVETDGKKEEFVVFDVSFRTPGSPGIAATPYSSYLFGRPVSMGERIAMEVKEAVAAGRLEDICS